MHDTQFYLTVAAMGAVLPNLAAAQAGDPSLLSSSLTFSWYAVSAGGSMHGTVINNGSSNQQKKHQHARGWDLSPGRVSRACNAACRCWWPRLEHFG